MNSDTDNISPRKGLSIVLTAHDQAAELERNLPVLLEQDYDSDYEVIVVDESSTDETSDVLKRMKAKYPRLYTTYIPGSSHYLSRKKLAITVGIKAARNEWVILTEASCRPENGEWLNAMEEYMTDDVDIVCGYTGFDSGTKSHYAYYRMINFCRQLFRPYRYDGANLAIRKSAFMERNGFLKNLQFLRGELDFIVNETEPQRIAVAKAPETWLRQEEPSRKDWVNRQLFYMQTRRSLDRTFLPRLLFVLWQSILHLSILLIVALLAYAVYKHNATYTGVAAGALVLWAVAHTFLCYRMTRKYGEEIPVWKLQMCDLSLAWHHLYYQLRYALSNKNDFLRK